MSLLITACSAPIFLRRHLIVLIWGKFADLSVRALRDYSWTSFILVHDMSNLEYRLQIALQKEYFICKENFNVQSNFMPPLCERQFVNFRAFCIVFRKKIYILSQEAVNYIFPPIRVFLFMCIAFLQFWRSKLNVIGESQTSINHRKTRLKMEWTVHNLNHVEFVVYGLRFWNLWSLSSLLTIVLSRCLHYLTHHFTAICNTPFSQAIWAINFHSYLLPLCLN